MLRSVGLVSVVLFSSLSGCGDSTGPVAGVLGRARWAQQNLHDYTYTGRRECFCGNAGRDVTVVVQADTVFSARAVGTTVDEPKGVWLTVNQLFDLAQASPAGNVERVRVEYHPRLGYPTVIEWVCSPNIADCDVTIETKNLEPIGLLTTGMVKEDQ